MLGRRTTRIVNVVQRRYVQSEARVRPVSGLPNFNRMHEGSQQFGGVPLTEDQTLLQAQVGFTKMITFNNERHFNRFDEKQLEQFLNKMKAWNASPRTKFLIFKGAGAGFFSGGLDPRSVYEHVTKKDFMAAANLLRDAFKLSYLVANCETPLATIQNGVMIGAGATMGMHANYSIVTPGAVYATPEVSYGYVPDCGNSFNLSVIDRQHPGVGTFIGMTGSVIRSTDLLNTGLGTHYAGSAGVGKEILGQLHEYDLNKITSAVIDRVVRNAVEDNRTPLSFAQDCSVLKQLFHGHKTYSQFWENLNHAANTTGECQLVAKKTLKKFEQMSPTAVKVTWKLMTLAQNKDMATCMQNEYRAAIRITQRSKDYVNGLQSILYDEPIGEWEPAISDSELEEWFTPLTFEKDQTCDIQFPEEVFGGDQILYQYEERLPK
jgi:enoyl-CoA hydratase/carnithine racemase